MYAGKPLLLTCKPGLRVQISMLVPSVQTTSVKIPINSPILLVPIISVGTFLQENRPKSLSTMAIPSTCNRLNIYSAESRGWLENRHILH